MSSKGRIARGRRAFLNLAASLLGFSAAGHRVVAASAPVAASRDQLVAWASRGVDDLLANYWQGDPSTGHIQPTNNGYVEAQLPHKLRNPRGGVWERGMLYNVLANYYALTGNKEILQRLHADWTWLASQFSEQDLVEVGPYTKANIASDDSGFDALFLLQVHAMTGDAKALHYAGEIVVNAYQRWGDQQLGGGVWYSDKRTSKSLYEVALGLAALTLYRQTKDKKYLDYAVGSEEWMRTSLRRSDGLYWCNLKPDGPVGQFHPNHYGVASSITYLGGDMGISLLQLRLAATLNRPDLADSAIGTARAVAGLMVDKDGVLFNDRDAWNDGYFAADWAREVVPKAGSGADTLRRTAAAIVDHDRTPEGYYGGDWEVVPAGRKPPWIYAGAFPNQIMTSANTVNMIVAAALLP